MGTKIFTITLFSILMVGAVDIFIEWYKTFLLKRRFDKKLIRLIIRIGFVLLAFVFWRALVAQQKSLEFASTHFFFALFIYCFYRLISSFSKKSE